MKTHTIDCNKAPKIPYDGWTVESHTKGGKIKWDASKVSLWLSDEQKTGRIEGNELRKKIPQGAFNANVLDYLLEHQELIPEEWKGKFIYFWGTVYRDSDGDLCVRYLDWRGGAWHWGYSWLDYYWLARDWSVGSPAAVPASALKSDTKTSSDSLPLKLPKELVINGITYIRK